MKKNDAQRVNRIRPPSLPKHLPIPLLPPECLEKGDLLTDLALTDWVASGQGADALTFEHMLIERSTLSRTIFRRLKMKDVRLLMCDLSNADWSYATWERVEILEGRLTGFRAAESKLEDTRFVGCKADLAQFRYATFRDVRFEDCVLREADFQGSDLRGVSFQGCDLRGANLSGAKLQAADFRGAKLEGILVHPEDVKGLVIDAQQAIDLSFQFAQLLGVKIVD